MALQPQSGYTVHPRLAGYKQEESRSVRNSFCSGLSLNLPQLWSDPVKCHLTAVKFHQHNSGKVIPGSTRGHARGEASHVLKCLHYFWTRAGSNPTISLNKQNKHLTGERSLQCSWKSLLLHVMICTRVFAQKNPGYSQQVLYQELVGA